jgi:hypothetical protein
MALKRITKGDEPKKKSTWKDVEENASIQERNKSAKSKYESEMSSYNKQMKVYNEKNVKGRRDMTFFQDGNRYLNPQELDEYNKRKSEEYGGLKASKVMVSKGYGKSNVDVSSKGEKGSYSGYLGAAHEWFNKPSAPTGPVYEKEKEINRNELEIPRMRNLKKNETFEGINTKKNVGNIIEKPKGKISITKKTEEQAPEWQAPSRRYTETKVTKSTARNAARNEGKLKSAKVSDISLKSKVAGLSYNREGKEAKAYYGGFEGQTKSDITERRGAIKAEKRELRQGIKDVRRGVTPASESLSKSERIQGYRKEIKNLRAENKQAKQAGKYFDKNLEARSFYDEGREVVRAQAKEKPGAKFFTPEAMKGYRESMNNPANRNTISAKIKNQKK